MSARGRRPRRPDSWSDAHARARYRVAERLDGPLDPAESAWLDDHLASCSECQVAASAYAAQRNEIRALADRPPVPPRDLWARTAAAIEREAAFRDRAIGRRSRRSLLAPYALLSAALVVAVVVGTLTSSQRFGGDGATASSLPGASAEASAGRAATPRVTPMPIPQKTIEWVTRDSNGNYQISTTKIDQVCSDAATPCPTTAPTETRPVDLNGNAKSVIGSPDGAQVIVVGVGGAPQTDNVSVHTLSPTSAPAASPPSSTAPSSSPSSTTPPSAPPVATPQVTPQVTASSQPASLSPSESPSASTSPTSIPSVEVAPSETAAGTVEIAHDVIVVGQGASYSPSGAWFAFTARPADGSTGPDIYVWRVAGGAQARALTTDHRSELGSWNGDVIVASTAVATSGGPVPATFLIDPQTGKQTLLPQAGNAWRPAVDPSSRQAVYWTGSLRPTTDGPGFAPDSGRLVLGTWSTQDSTPSSEPSASGSEPSASGSEPSASGSEPSASGSEPSASGSDPSASSSALSAPSGVASPTAPADQSKNHNETTIAAGPISDWDARWDETGTRLAVWIADQTDPSIGRLSLYAVDQFDGQIDLKKPLVDGRVAKAGYAISKGRLVWAEPAPRSGSGDGRSFVFAWTDKGSGEIEGVPGPVIVIR